MLSHREPMRTKIVDTAAFDFLKREIAEVNEASVAIALSGDPGEYVWFRDITANPDVVSTVNLDEAQRALGFVFGWITRWESFHDSYIPDREHRRQVEQRRVRTAPGPARVSAVRVLEGDDDFRAEVDLVDVPESDDYILWRDMLSRILNEHQGPRTWWRVTDSGKLVLRTAGKAEAGETVIASELAECLTSALVRVEDDMLRRRTEDEASRNALKADAVAYNESYEAVASMFPSWVERVWITDHLQIMGGVPQSRLRFSIVEAARPYWQDIASGLRENPEVEQCILSGRDWSLQVSPQLNVEKLCSVLQTISMDIEEKVARDSERRQLEEEFCRSLETQLKEAFGL
jgi:hypothetical protein